MKNKQAIIDMLEAMNSRGGVVSCEAEQLAIYIFGENEALELINKWNETLNEEYKATEEVEELIEYLNKNI